MTGRWQLVVFVMLCALGAQAFTEIPKDSVKALKITKGKAFKSGVVFVNGKFMPPPYVVERYGNGVRISRTQVTGELIGWGEFLKTQSGVKETRTEVMPEGYKPAAVQVAKPKEDDMASALDDLFEDVPAKGPQARRSAVVTPAAPPKPKTVVTYSIDGEFVPNEATKKMVANLNQQRTAIDAKLRAGGFIFFGDAYARVDGDARMAIDMLGKVAEIQRTSETLEQFKAKIQSANLVFINDALAADLYRNRIDYVKLQGRCSELKEELEANRLLNGN